MTLLAPISAVIALGVALPTLLAFYLLKLRRRPVRVSSTMFWEQATRDLQVNVPLRWLRASLLLLLHVLILLLLVGALGRPAVMGGEASRASVFIVIDRTASMSATDAGGGRSRFEAAVTRAGELADDMLSGLGAPSVTLIAMGREARVITPPTRSRAEISRALGALGPTDQPGRLSGALTLVESLLDTDTDEGARATRPLVVVISDGSSAVGSALSLAGARVRFERVGPGADGGRDNVGIVGLGASRDSDDPALVRLFVALQSVRRERTATTLDISVDGTPVQRRPVVIEGAGEDPARATGSAELRLPRGGVVRVVLERGDALVSDNAAQLVFGAPSKPSVLVVAPEASPDRFLRDVLEELDLGSLRVVAPEDYRRFLTGDMSAIDLVVLDRAGAPAPGVASLSFGVPVPGLVERASPAGGERVVSWKRADPVLRDVSLDTLIVDRGALLAPDPDAAGVRTEALAIATGGGLIWRTEATGVERIAVAFPISRSNWGLQLSLPMFVANAVESLTGRGAGDDAVRFLTSEPAQITLPGARGTLRLRGPVDVEIEIPETQRDASAINLGVLERAGVYRIENEPGGAVCVNLLDAHESLIASPATIQIGGREIEARGRGDAPVPREVWHWFVLGAAVLLVLEWGLYAWRMRV